jgi:hypothetical protein
MRMSSLEKAKARLRFARRAVQIMCDPALLTENPYDHWIDFLTQWKGVYTKVQQAAKDTPQELQWFGKVNRERKQNPVTRYLFEARNDEEHGMDNSATLQRGVGEFRMIRGGERGAHVQFENFEPARIVDDDGNVIAEKIRSQPLIAELHPVKDRGSNIVPVPTAKDGSVLNHVTVAELGIQYLEALVAQAEAMQTPSQ